ncbi:MULTISPECIES: FecR family protein [unclassified Xanthobacter]|uniref:FecR family protein n=1 Tax=unclassified Xanthobacter TaxID=2623496 RepID=UPI001EE0ECDC|nr:MULTISPECIES: FecR domain-containing protein [unclassified Xanthobacter]
MPISTPARLLASVASLALVAASDAALAQQTVGTAAAVNPRSTGVGASGARTLQLGSPIIRNERVQTSESGTVQVVFLDKTTLNIGPRSDLVIDQFVFDPARDAGSMAVDLAKGTLRFVGGQASHGGAASVRTPVATIGIRGGVATFAHRDGVTRAVLQFGQLDVVGPGGQSVTLRRPGFMVDVSGQGISAPARVPQAEMDALLAETRSRPGQTGGRRQAPPPDMPVTAAAAHPCSRPAQGQTTLDLAVATCRSSNTRLQGEADLIVEQASQQGQDYVLHPIEQQIPPPYGY